METKNCKITVGGIEVEGMGKWSFDTFKSEADKEKAREQIEDMYAAHDKKEIKQEKGNE